MKSHRNYHSLLGGTSGSNDSSGFGTSVDGLLRSQSDDEMLDITTGTTDDLRNVPNRSHGNSNLLRNGGGNLVESERMDAAEEDYGKYDDFHTIDWQRDVARDRLRHRILKRRRGDGIANFCRCVFDALSAWVCVSVVGIFSGVFAGIIDIGASWLSDLKNGVCHPNFWLTREACCWASNMSHPDDSGYHIDCPAWQAWPQVWGYSGTSAGVDYVLSYMMYVLIGVFFGVTSVLLVRVLAPYACGSGIPEIKTILSGFIIRGYLGKWTLVIKSISLMLAVASGLSLGKEGPLVHVACCIGNILSYMFPKYGKNEAKKREILSAASAAGVSVAFGAPIGGVLFSLEEVSYYFPLKTLWRSFFCALVAAFVLRSMNPFNDQQAVMFFINYNDPWYLFELIPFVLIGIFGGLWGALFIKANIYWCRIRKTTILGRSPILEVVVLVLVTALFAFHVPFTRMSGPELIAILFGECDPAKGQVSNLCDFVYNSTANSTIAHAGTAGPGVRTALWHLTLALIFKCVITVFTFGVKTPAGLFIPSMAIGAIVGRMVGIGVNQLVYAYPDSYIFQADCAKVDGSHTCITPGVYALVGAAAALGGVTRMTISLVVIMFELTGGLTYIIPIMFACMTAKWVGDAFGNRGIYDAHIELNEYPYLDNKKSLEHVTLSGQVMRPKPGTNEPPLVIVKQEGMKVKDIKAILKDSTYNGFPVVVSEESQYLVGFVARKDLAAAIDNSSRHIVDSNPDDASVFFTEVVPAIPSPSEGPSLRLRRILDLAPITITDQTPMETVVDMFTKLGLRQLLVTHNGRLLGIITKKDVLNHLQNVKGMKAY